MMVLLLSFRSSTSRSMIGVFGGIRSSRGQEDVVLDYGIDKLHEDVRVPPRDWDRVQKSQDVATVHVVAASFKRGLEDVIHRCFWIACESASSFAGVRGVVHGIHGCECVGYELGFCWREEAHQGVWGREGLLDFLECGKVAEDGRAFDGSGSLEDHST